MEDNHSRFYHPELDCLRFVAFLSVFVYHLDQQFHTVVALNSPWQWMVLCTIKCGIFGVDLFFCLSSFLITMLLLREYDLRGTLDVRAFWIRRILRIWPLYYAFLLFTATVSPYWLGQQAFSGWRLFHYWFFLGNWDCVWHDWHHSPAGPLWSVSVEEQFYLAWPLLLVAVKPKRILLLAVVALLGANIYRMLHHPPTFVQQWANTMYHVDPIAWGVIGAWFAHSGRLKLSLLLRPVLLLTGLFLMPAYFYCQGFPAFFDGKDSAVYPISAVSCILVVISLYDLQAVPWNSAVMKGWAYLGRISYGLYVFHMLALTWFILFLYNHGLFHGELLPLFSGLKLASFAAILVLTIVLAWASYTFLETPFLKLKRKYTYVPSAPQTNLKGTDL